MAKTLHVFDYDDSLTYTPTYAEYLGADDDGFIDIEKSSNLDSNKAQLRSVQHIFSLVFGKNVIFQAKGDFIIIVDASNKRPLPGEYVAIIEDKVEQVVSDTPKDEFVQKIGVRRGDLRDFPSLFAEKDGLLILNEIRGFHKDENTIGAEVNEELVDIYNSAANKMIVTGRSDKLKRALDMTLRWIPLEYPNWGLHCYPSNTKLSIPKWKCEVIIEAAKKGGFDIVHFYEDRANWLKETELKFKEELPEVEFIGHHIVNIKNSRSL